MRRILPALLILAAPVPAWAGHASPVADPVAAKECSACHIAFQPAFLPAASWQKLMEPQQLSNHFGDDASLPDAARKQIEDYYVRNAGGRMAGSEPVLRISETKYWQRKHRPGEVNPAAFQDPKVKSKANCAACHKQAARGFYEDEEEGEREGRFWRR